MIIFNCFDELSLSRFFFSLIQRTLSTDSTPLFTVLIGCAWVLADVTPPPLVSQIGWSNKFIHNIDGDRSEKAQSSVTNIEKIESRAKCVCVCVWFQEFYHDCRINLGRELMENNRHSQYWKLPTASSARSLQSLCVFCIADGHDTVCRSVSLSLVICLIDIAIAHIPPPLLPIFPIFINIIIISSVLIPNIGLARTELKRGRKSLATTATVKLWAHFVSANQFQFGDYSSNTTRTRRIRHCWYALKICTNYNADACQFSLPLVSSTTRQCCATQKQFN